MLSLSAKSKRCLAAYCSAYALEDSNFSNESCEFSKYISQESNTTRSDYFRPTKKNFFKRIQEPHFTEIAIEIMGKKWVEENQHKTRAYISERMELAVSGEDIDLAQWLPKGF